MPCERPNRGVLPMFAVGECVFCNGEAMVVCGVCRCGSMWLYECRPEHEPATAPRLHAERFLGARTDDVRPDALRPAKRIARRRQFARRAEL